jgi:hypothetical protein
MILAVDLWNLVANDVENGNFRNFNQP